MLSTSVYIYNSTSSGGGSYSSTLYWSPSAQADYLAIGDILEDSTGNQYMVTTWVGYPSDNSEGNTVTMNYVTTDTLPTDSIAVYDGFVFTPDQEQIAPRVQTDGSIAAISVYSGTDYEYTATGSWNNSIESNKALVGDQVMDKNGKVYEITFIDGSSRFSVPFRMKEVEEIGIIAPEGLATLFSPTRHIYLFQGTNINVLAETSVRNRDNYILDNLQDHTKEYTNVEGVNITRNQIVFESSAGNVQLARADDTLGLGVMIGVVWDSIITNGVVGNIVVKPGVRLKGFTNLIPTQPVYLSKTTAGSIQQDTTGYVVGDHQILLGTALSSTELLYNPEYKIEY